MDPVTIAMIPIPSGTFRMGSTGAEVDRCVAFWSGRFGMPAAARAAFRRWIEKEFPAHERRVDGFSLSRAPVTNAAYRAYLARTGAAPPESIRRGLPDDHPVWGVRFEEAEAFARSLRSEAGVAFRLPTEAEWEYAARGRGRREFPYGDDFDPTRANSRESGIGVTTPVDRYRMFASPFGLWDMAGNVEEWVAGQYGPYPGGAFVQDHFVSAGGHRYRLLRGGSCIGGGDLARCARRHGAFGGDTTQYIGFRVAAATPRGSDGKPWRAYPGSTPLHEERQSP